MEIRIAQEEDVPYLLDIYNYEVLHGKRPLISTPGRCRSGSTGTMPIT